QNPLVIELPKGGYVPQSRHRAVGPTRGAREKRLWFAAGLVGLVVVAAAGMRWPSRNETPVTIAGLPLANLSDDPGSDSFADGVTDEVIRQASGIAGLTVRSRTSSFALKGRPHTVREAASELNVAYIVEGSVARSGPEVRITAQLVRARDDVPIWTGTFNRQLRNALEIQRVLSLVVVNALQLKLGHGLRRYDTEAYDLYLRARAVGNVRFAGDDEAIGLFEQAISRDPSIAPAYAGLAVAYAFRSFDNRKDPEQAH